MKHDINLRVNGDAYRLTVESWRTLNEVLREDLNLTGTKLGCGSGDCGACTVIVDGKSVSSCLTLAVEMVGKEIRVAIPPAVLVANDRNRSFQRRCQFGRQSKSDVRE